jgi:hypothetical protein
MQMRYTNMGREYVIATIQYDSLRGVLSEMI